MLVRKRIFQYKKFSDLRSEAAGKTADSRKARFVLLPRFRPPRRMAVRRLSAHVFPRLWRLWRGCDLPDGCVELLRACVSAVLTALTRTRPGKQRRGDAFAVRNHPPLRGCPLLVPFDGRFAGNALFPRCEGVSEIGRCPAAQNRTSYFIIENDFLRFPGRRNDPAALT